MVPLEHVMYVCMYVDLSIQNPLSIYSLASVYIHCNIMCVFVVNLRTNNLVPSF